MTWVRRQPRRIDFGKQTEQEVSAMDGQYRQQKIQAIEVDPLRQVERSLQNLP